MLTEKDIERRLETDELYDLMLENDPKNVRKRTFGHVRPAKIQNFFCVVYARSRELSIIVLNVHFIVFEIMNCSLLYFVCTL